MFFFLGGMGFQAALGTNKNSLGTVPYRNSELHSCAIILGSLKKMYLKE